MQFGNKKVFGSKNPSTLDLEVSRMRPRIINQERERLYDDAMKHKIATNFFKEENIKIKTRIHLLEAELIKKDKLIDELLLQQDSFTGAKPLNKMRLESHLTQNLKKKIKDLHTSNLSKNDEIEALKRSIKSTKINEIEVELKMYMDECTRLRHSLEEVIRSKDTFADPEELRVIEEKFQ